MLAIKYFSAKQFFYSQLNIIFLNGCNLLTIHFLKSWQGFVKCKLTILLPACRCCTCNLLTYLPSEVPRESPECLRMTLNPIYASDFSKYSPQKFHGTFCKTSETVIKNAIGARANKLPLSLIHI